MDVHDCREDWMWVGVDFGGTPHGDDGGWVSNYRPVLQGPRSPGGEELCGWLLLALWSPVTRLLVPLLVRLSNVVGLRFAHGT
jgi:hypothetical protein